MRSLVDTMPYMTQKEYRNLKSALTRAINSKDQQRIVRTCTAALERFEECVAPDDWCRWQRAKEDAERQIGMAPSWH
jgi:hypothetical protein